MKDIPRDFILTAIDTFLEAATKFPEGEMRKRLVTRAEYYLDLIESWDASQEEGVH